MPHLSRHALDGIGVLAVIEVLVDDVQNKNNASGDQ
ncbi:hypothetical protein ACVILL_000943 [Bradyrhizobium sp. USDA 3364]